MYFNPRQRLELSLFEGVEAYAAAEAAWEVIPIPDYRFNTREILPSMDLDGLVMATWQFRPMEGIKWRFPVSACYQELPSYPGSCMENSGAGRLAADHLLGLGAKTLVYFPDLSRGEMDAARFAAFREQAESQGRKVLRFTEGERMKGHGWSLENQIADLAAFLRRHGEPLGVFCFDDVHGERMILASGRAGRRIPEDVAIVAVTDTPAFCEALRPGLSAVVVDSVGMGLAAAEILDRQLRGETEALHIQVPPKEIQARKSTQVLLSRDEYIVRANAWLEARPPSEWSVEALGAEMRCGAMTLFRRFRRELGRGPQEEIIRRKVERARLRLLETEDTVSSIAQDCGFADAAHFSRVFSKEAGMPPGKYRKTQQVN